MDKEDPIEALDIWETTYARLQSLGIKTIGEIPRWTKKLKKLGFTKRQIEDLRKAFKWQRKWDRERNI